MICNDSCIDYMRLVYESLRFVTIWLRKERKNKMNYIEQFMEDNNLEVNEEFYVIDENGTKIGGLISIIFYFDKNMRLKMKLVESDCRDVFRGLMSGKYRIEKIPQKPKTVWDLTEEDKYYYIDLYGDIYSTFYDRDEDVDIIKCGNAFLTEKEARFEVERRKCEAVLLKYGTRDMRSFEDYDDKYYIMYDNTGKNVDVSCCTFRQNQGVIYFKTIELAQKAIDEVTEDRLKRYVFNVKE